MQRNEHFEAQFFLWAIIAVAVLVVLIFLPELNAIVLGITFAVLFYPWYAWLKKNVMPNHDGIAALLIVLAALLIIVVPLMFFGFQIFREAQGLYNNVSSGREASVINFFRNQLSKISPSFNLNLDLYVQQILGLFINNLGRIFSGVASLAATFFLSFFALFYFLKDGARLNGTVVKSLPLSEEHTNAILSKLHSMTSSVVRGSLLISVLYGIFIGIGFFLFGLPSAVLWGGVTVVAAFIPAIGVLLVVVPGIISLALSGSFAAAIGLTVWMFAVSTVMEAFLRPRLIGRNAHINPLLLLFSVLGGLSFFGPIGILLGPIALSLLLTLLDAYPLISSGSAATI